MVGDGFRDLLDPKLRKAHVIVPTSAHAAAPLLQVSHLRTHFFTDAGVVKAVEDVSFTLTRARRSPSSANPAPASR